MCSETCSKMATFNAQGKGKRLFMARPYTKHSRFYVLVCPISCRWRHLCFLSEVAAGHSVVVEVSPDIHICGFCKQQYNNFEVFLAHKQNGCSLPTCGVSPPTTTTAITGKIRHKPCEVLVLICLSHAGMLVVFLSRSDSSCPNAQFVFDEPHQTCLMKGVKKILTKAQNTPSKKLKPALNSKRYSCCFSGWYKTYKKSKTVYI